MRHASCVPPGPAASVLMLNVHVLRFGSLGNGWMGIRMDVDVGCMYVVCICICITSTLHIYIPTYNRAIE